MQKSKAPEEEQGGAAGRVGWRGRSVKSRGGRQRDQTMRDTDGQQSVCVSQSSVLGGCSEQGGLATGCPRPPPLGCSPGEGGRGARATGRAPSTHSDSQHEPRHQKESLARQPAAHWAQQPAQPQAAPARQALLLPLALLQPQEQRWRAGQRRRPSVQPGTLPAAALPPPQGLLPPAAAVVAAAARARPLGGVRGRGDEKKGISKGGGPTVGQLSKLGQSWIGAEQKEQYAWPAHLYLPFPPPHLLPVALPQEPPLQERWQGALAMHAPAPPPQH